jgi:hypothetical protein
MQNNDHNECPFSDEIISYMYDEMALAEMPKFEQHLSECEVCTDEFAAISFARFETYDWKRVEFDILQTPRVVIPYAEKTVTLGERISAGMSWVTVVPAAAALVVCLGVGYLVIVNSGGNTETKTIAEAPKPEQKISTPSVPAAPAPEIASTGTKGVNSGVKVIAASSKSKSSIPKTLVARRVGPAVRLGNDLAVNVRQAPRLGIKDEEEDRSLRLSDLFDETNPPPQR